MAREDQRGQPARTRRVEDERDPHTAIPEQPNEDENWSDDANCGNLPSKPENRHPKSNSNSHRRRREPVQPAKSSDSRKKTYANDLGSFGQAGGQAVPYGHSIYHGNEPFAPLPQPVPPLLAPQHPPNPYIPNPHPSFQYPASTSTKPPGDQYINSHPGPPQHYTYPMNVGSYHQPLGMEPPTYFPDAGHPYFGNYSHVPSQPLPSFGGMPMAEESSQMATISALEDKLKRTQRKLNNANEKRERDRRRALKRQNEAAALKDLKSDSEARHVEHLVREEIYKFWQRERNMMDFETQSEPVRSSIGYDTRGPAGDTRHAHDYMHYSNENAGKMDQLREEIAQIVEGKRQYLSQRKSSGSILDAQARSKLHVKPRTAFESVTDPEFRDQLESTVVDILRRLNLNDVESDLLHSLSSPYRTMSDCYPAREGQRRPRDWQTGMHGSRPIDPVMHSSNFTHTHMEGDQNPPFESSRRRSQPQDDDFASRFNPAQDSHKYRMPYDDANLSNPSRNFGAYHNIARETGSRGYRTNTGQVSGTRDRRNSDLLKRHTVSGRQVEFQDRPRSLRDPEMHAPSMEDSSDGWDDQESSPDRQPAPYSYIPNRQGLENDFPLPSAPEPPRREHGFRYNGQFRSFN